MMRFARRASLLVALCILAAVSLSGCLSVPPRPPDLHTVSIGPPPGDYEAQIQQYFRSSLLDPYSAVYEIRTPTRGWEHAATLCYKAQ